jgi:hypothetical protein
MVALAEEKQPLLLVCVSAGPAVARWRAMQQLYQVADFIRAIRRRLRFGELSRAPIQILRLELRGDSAECDWMMRPPDVWDSHLSSAVRDESTTHQALSDAMALREMLLEELSSIRSAVLRGFRSSARETLEAIISGTVTREEPRLLRVASPVMRAKLCGFQFELENGFLKPMKSDDGSQPDE